MITIEKLLESGNCYNLNDKKIINISDILKVKKILFNENYFTIKSFSALDEVSKIPDLSKFKNLKILKINNTSISSIDFLKDNMNIEELNLKNNKIKSISQIIKFKNLKRLHLNKNEIEKIEGLDNCRNLEFLSLDDNKIEIIEGLDNCSNLKKLVLSNNKINKIDNLNRIGNSLQLKEKILEELSLNFNKIKQIPILIGFNNLELLGLQGNEILKIENLDSMKNLKYISVNENPLKYSKYKNKNDITEKMADIGIENEKLLEYYELYKQKIQQLNYKRKKIHKKIHNNNLKIIKENNKTLIEYKSNENFDNNVLKKEINFGY